MTDCYDCCCEIDLACIVLVTIIAIILETLTRVIGRNNRLSLMNFPYFRSPESFTSSRLVFRLLWTLRNHQMREFGIEKRTDSELRDFVLLGKSECRGDDDHSWWWYCCYSRCSGRPRQQLTESQNESVVFFVFEVYICTYFHYICIIHITHSTEWHKTITARSLSPVTPTIDQNN